MTHHWKSDPQQCLINCFLPSNKNIFETECALYDTLIAYRLSLIAYRLSLIAYRLSLIAYRLSLIAYRYAGMYLQTGMYQLGLQRMTVITGLRTDHALRSAVKNLQSFKFETKGNTELFQQTLLRIAELTHPTYSFLLVVGALSRTYLPEAIRETKAATYFTLQTNLSTSKTRLSAASHLNIEQRVFKPNRYWSQLIEGQQVLICNEPLSAEQLAVFPPDHPLISNALFLPIYDRGEFIALVGLTNRTIPFHDYDSTRLQPLIGVFISAIKCPKDGEGSLTVKNNLSPASSKRLISDMISASLDAVIITDEDYIIMTFNQVAENIFGIQAKHAIGLPIDRFISAPATISSEKHLHRSVRSTTAGIPHLWRGATGRRGDGQKFLLDLSFISTDIGKSKCTTFICDDISDHIESSREGRENLQRFKALTNLAPVGIIQVDQHWYCTYANDEWCELTNSSLDEVLGMGWLNAFHQQDVDGVLHELRASLDHHHFSKEFRLRNVFGQVTWVKGSARALFDERGSVSGFLATIADITSNRTIESQLRKIAESDTLTGLVSRSFFEDRLQHALDCSKRHGQVVLLFIDLDGFKSINDTLGHDQGDELLKLAAQRILTVVRSEDTVSRFGGDEFTVILGGMPDEHYATQVAQKIIENIRMPFCLGEQEVFITTSLGIAMGNFNNSNAATLIKHADIALYRAKGLGRNNFQFFTPELDIEANKRMKLTNSLHRALERKEFKLFYQPMLDVRTNKVMGFEALLRWHPKGVETFIPEQFIYLLEESGLIESVGNWVIRTACEQMSQWLQAGHFDKKLTQMSVNVSARQLIDPQFYSFVTAALRETGLGSEHLVLEVTESLLMKDCENIQKLLKKLRKHGVKIALDDFGTGYSSLGYLRTFSIDQLKIDRSFIDGLLDSTADTAIIQAIITLGKSLNLMVVAEGVDSQEKLDVLRSLECDIYQGYYYDEPLSAESVVTRLLPHQCVSDKDHVC